MVLVATQLVRHERVQCARLGSRLGCGRSTVFLLKVDTHVEQVHEDGAESANVGDDVLLAGALNGQARNLHVELDMFETHGLGVAGGGRADAGRELGENWREQTQRYARGEGGAELAELELDLRRGGREKRL